MSPETLNIGKQGEIIAANYLQKNGYEIVSMNFANDLGYRRGELDIVAKDSKTGEIVFVEVKSRQKSFYTTDPAQAITKQKYFRLSRIISNYLNRNNLSEADYRLDAIAIEIDAEKRKASLKHLKHIYL